MSAKEIAEIREALLEAETYYDNQRKSVGLPGGNSRYTSALAALSRLEAERPKEWISVKERLPALGEIVECAISNNGEVGRAYAGRYDCDEGWAWAIAEACLLWGGLPVGLEEDAEWDENTMIAWKPLSPLPPPPKED